METTTYHLLVLLSCTAAAATTAMAKYPPTKTFSYTNTGDFGPYIAEYGATYRILPIATSPFQLCFYNTTPGAFYLALRMGTRRSESPFRFVWTANPSRPVGENAIFSLDGDGELRLIDADTTLVFFAGTINQPVASLRILPNGNIVLLSSTGRRFLWQSFEHPSDTLLVGQALRAGHMLVSRAPGKYSLIADPSGIGLYINTEQSGPVMYSTGDGRLRLPDRGRIESVVFESAPETENAYELSIRRIPESGRVILTRPKYNATFSFLRMEADGNLVAYTYYDPVDYGAWERTFELFSREKGFESRCRRPGKCGELGVCANEMCVACPTAEGLVGWTKSCAPRVTRCEGGGFYKVEGVDTFVSRIDVGFEGEDGVKECFRRCRIDCLCLGILHFVKENKCWLTPRLGSPAIGTLEKVNDPSHVMWIKS